MFRTIFIIVALLCSCATLPNCDKKIYKTIEKHSSVFIISTIQLGVKCDELRQNCEMIEREKQLHLEAGYKGDVVDKMYKSVRYYYRKKKVETTTEKKEQQRREYVALDRELLREMDEHIENNRTIKPATAFDDFCENNKELIKNEALRLKKYLKANEIGEKIKKTYKNRHFNTITSERE